jgi:FMN-dependent NADH-azoreductase
MKLLHVDSSILGTNSVTRELGAAVVKTWLHENPGGQVRHLDLARDPLPHLTGEVFGARSAPTLTTIDSVLSKEIDLDRQALEEFLAADVVVIGAPMYNFSIPSQLKAWIDRIVVAGKTFRYTERGPEGLTRGKKVVVISARGGIYGAGSPAAAMDFQEAYLRGVLGFIGVTDIEFIRAEGLSRGAEQRESALASARETATRHLSLVA